MSYRKRTYIISVKGGCALEHEEQVMVQIWGRDEPARGTASADEALTWITRYALAHGRTVQLPIHLKRAGIPRQNGAIRQSTACIWRCVNRCQRVWHRFHTCTIVCRRSSRQAAVVVRGAATIPLRYGVVHSLDAATIGKTMRLHSLYSRQLIVCAPD